MSTPAPVVLIACDKFKGTLTASQACEAVAAGIRQCWPGARCILRPIADGGEGTARVICESQGGEWRNLQVTGPMGDPVNAGWAWLPETRTAIVEMSEASGLRLTLPERRNPWRATTAGTGQLMQAAVAAGAQQLVVAIGGSATNDGGAGMAWALGYRFLDENGQAFFPLPATLSGLARIVPPEELVLPEVVAACDVTNPLLGPEGATPVYGPQKGVTLERIPEYEAALQRLADVVKQDLGADLARAPGAGAAGGLGFGLLTFARARMEPGFDLVSRVAGLEQAIREADIVITGEGSVDAQTLHGKGPAGLADMARRMGKPVIAIGGLVEEKSRSALLTRFHHLIAAADPANLADALENPARTVTAAIVKARRAMEAALEG